MSARLFDIPARRRALSRWRRRRRAVRRLTITEFALDEAFSSAASLRIDARVLALEALGL